MSDPSAVTAPPRHTPLYERHVAARGKIIDFGGWALPVQYATASGGGGIIEEHKHVRSAAGLFDVSHMGEIRFRGPGAREAVQRLVTNDVGKLHDEQAQYTCACLPTGGIVDDCIVYRHAEDDFLIVVNASNVDKDFAWFHAEGQAAAPHRVTITNESEATALLAVQGPKALGVVRALVAAPAALDALPSFHFLPTLLGDVAATVARTGYTGEDGCEIFCAAPDAVRLWDALMDAGKGTLRPIGLGARDTLRLEARLSLYGNDIDEQHTPHEAGLSWVVKGRGFLGEEALAKQKAEGPRRKLVGFIMSERGIARHGYPILDEQGAKIGEVTSGTTGPTVEAAIGLGYVPSARAEVGASLIVDCRGKPARAEIVKGPFYKRPPLDIRSATGNVRGARIMSNDFPEGLRYTKEHEWARVEGRIATIGITRFAVEQLGDITQVDLPKEGETISKDEVFGTIESVKAVSDLFAPCTGKVVKVNDPLSDSPEYVNEDPYDEGWMVQIELENPAELDGLMSADEYQAFLKEQQ